MLQTKRIAAALLALLVLAGAPGADAEPAAAGPETAVADAGKTVASLYEALLTVMKRADELGLEGRAEFLAPVVSSTYDLEAMAARVLGRRGWGSLSTEQRGRWLEAFSSLTIHTYAGRFDGYDGEKLEVLDVEEGGRGTALVRTRIVRSDDEPVAIDYRLHPAGGGWRIVDVYLNGTVSELALRRSEYSGVLKRDGFDVLVESIEAKAAAGGDPY